MTDAGDNETSYYEDVLRRMKHPRTDGQTILNLRVMLLSEAWNEGYRRAMNNISKVIVPTYDLPEMIVLAKAA